MRHALMCFVAVVCVRLVVQSADACRRDRRRSRSCCICPCPCPKASLYVKRNNLNYNLQYAHETSSKILMGTTVITSDVISKTATQTTFTSKDWPTSSPGTPSSSVGPVSGASASGDFYY